MSDYFPTPVPGRRAATAPAWPGAAPVRAQTVAPGWPPYTARPMSGAVLAALIAGTALAVIVVIGILAAIAIPVFLDQRNKAAAAHTSVVIPEQVVGLSRMHDARSQQLEEQLRAQPGTPEVGIYGVDGSVRAAVAVTRHAMTSSDERNFFAGAEGSSEVAYAPAATGSLGGTMRCGTAPTRQFSVCLFVDRGAFGSITLFGELVGRTDTSVAIREAVEHRR